MKIEKIILGYFAVNCYIILLKDLSILIDPGADFDRLQKFLISNNIMPDLIINTHGHYDHIGAVPELVQKYNIPFYIDKEEEQVVIDPEINCSSFFSQNTLSLNTYHLISSADRKYFNSFGISIIKTPGHTPGSIIIKISNMLFTGDLIFRGAIGRTDLPGGSLHDIKNSLSKLMVLDKELEIFPGHGSSSTLEYEFRTNPYLNSGFLAE
ncbi:MAG: MBL fold metallo-hydrolase [Actinobacteria bacterium]|nr:MBL fold metallo-hydrolase [Actinomycetota bacterium]